MDFHIFVEVNLFANVSILSIFRDYLLILLIVDFYVLYIKFLKNKIFVNKNIVLKWNSILTKIRTVGCSLCIIFGIKCKDLLLICCRHFSKYIWQLSIYIFNTMKEFLKLKQSPLDGNHFQEFHQTIMQNSLNHKSPSQSRSAWRFRVISCFRLSKR